MNCSSLLLTMNVNLLHKDFLDHHEDWLPDAIAETGKEQADGLKKQGGTQQDDTEIFRGRYIKSSSGNEFNDLEFNKAYSHSLESHESSVRTSNVQDKCQSKSKSEKLTAVIQEMKQYLPTGKVESGTKTSIVTALNHALKCVQQVQNSKAFLFGGEHGSYQTDARVYDIKELAEVTSKHTLKNTDTFVAVFSLLSGKMVHISEQAASILNCKKRLLDSSHFADLLAPQDVGIFFTHTSHSFLPLWDMKPQTASVYEYAQVKSFFCRIRVGRDQDKCYSPFRITPYLVNVYQNHSEPECCCLAVVDKIHSGYEAPQIPLEKRIFTTAHAPGCAFVEIDDRAVPLLGYLPQDLIGTSILMHLHPEDRPLMIAVHRKVLKFAGQPPFEHSAIRFCTQNGDYIIVDTSWSSFVNPWSRKVVFIIGRHKVRTGPLNKDVFAARSREGNCVDTEIRELQGQIYKLLLQPVHGNGSSGYASLVSNGSYEHYISVASSSDSNGNRIEEMQSELKVPVDVNKLKNMGQQLYIESHSTCLRDRGRALDAELPRGKQHSTFELPCAEAPVEHYIDSRGTYPVLSYQEMNCVDSIIRYLESYSVSALKRKCESAYISSSSSDDDRPVQLIQNKSHIFKDASGLSSITSQPPVVPVPEVATEPQASSSTAGPPMTDMAPTTKALSVVSVISQCSYSSTFVHVPHPKSEVTAIEEATLPSEQAELFPTGGQTPTASPEEIIPVGLTKEFLSAHTQKEEQNYVDQFRQKILLPRYRSYLQQGQVGSDQAHSRNQDFCSKQTRPVNCKGNNKQGKCKRFKQLESSDKNFFSNNGSRGKRTASPKPSYALSEGSQPGSSSVIHSVNPYLTSGFPIASLGGEQHMWPLGDIAPVIPSLVSLQPIPLVPASYMGSFSTVLLHSFPVFPSSPQPFFHIQHPSTTNPYNPMMPSGPPSSIAPESVEPVSPSATFLSAEEEPQETSDSKPPFSNSRSSSPLQLDLLQEEMPKPLELPSRVLAKMHMETKCDQDGEDSGNSDGHSVSRELFDLLLHGDSQLGTGSAASASGSAESISLVSGSNGTSGTGSGNSSRYFASSDSSEASTRGKKNQKDARQEAPAQPTRITAEVLKGDLEKLAAMTKQQPKFTKRQKEELAEVHPWIRTQTIPQEINIQGCATCDKRNANLKVAEPDD